MRNLNFEGKITIFKTFAVSKIMFLASVTVLLNSAITKLNKIHKEFIWNHKKSEIKEKTLCNYFDKDDLKDIEIQSKKQSLIYVG